VQGQLSSVPQKVNTESRGRAVLVQVVLSFSDGYRTGAAGRASQGRAPPVEDGCYGRCRRRGRPRAGATGSVGDLRKGGWV
jgi:hypothetical protein